MGARKFRPEIFGFKREDVVNYIEQVTKVNRDLKAERDKLFEENQNLRREPGNRFAYDTVSGPLPPPVPFTVKAAEPGTFDAERAKLIASNNALLQELEVCKLENGNALAQLGKVLTERDAAIAELGAAREPVQNNNHSIIAERDEAIRERNGAYQERDSIISERNTAIIERDEAIRERDKAEEERGGLSAELEEAKAENKQLKTALEISVSKLKELSDENDEIKTERDAAKGKMDSLSDAFKAFLER
jgi:uncharacterized protein (DUF3084 family)